QAQLYGEAERRRRQAEEMAENLERSQGQPVRTERLRALGEMAAGVAHDFNNLLSVILGRAELMLRRVHESALVRDLEAVRRAAQDGADTVRRIQEFTRTRRTRAFERVDLGAVAREVVELTRPQWELEAQSRGVRYEFSVEGTAPPVAGRPEELREVLTNLVTNAVDAMPDGGRCTRTPRAGGSPRTSRRCRRCWPTCCAKPATSSPWRRTEATVWTAARKSRSTSSSATSRCPGCRGGRSRRGCARAFLRFRSAS